MKHFVIIIISVLLIAGCNTKPKLSSLEFIDFSWSSWNSKTGNEVPIFFKCDKYAYINKDGEIKLFAYKNSPPTTFYYCYGHIDPILIRNFESITNQSSKATLDSVYFDFINPPSDPNEAPRIYDGTFIKVRSNYDDGSSTLYNLIDDDYSPIIKSLYDTIIGIAQKSTTFNFREIEKLDSAKFVFINDVIKEDIKFLPQIIRIEKPIRVLKNDTIITLPE